MAHTKSHFYLIHIVILRRDLENYYIKTIVAQVVTLPIFVETPRETIFSCSFDLTPGALGYSIVQPLAVVYRCSDTQLQVAEQLCNW